MTAAAVARMGEIADDLCDDLDRILSRVIRNDAVLAVERESDKWHVVTDTANGDEVMLRAELDVCVRFMEAFVVKHPGSRIDVDALELARGAAGWRELVAETLTGFSVRVAAMDQVAEVIPIHRGAA